MTLLKMTLQLKSTLKLNISLSKYMEQNDMEIQSFKGLELMVKEI